MTLNGRTALYCTTVSEIDRVEQDAETSHCTAQFMRLSELITEI